jgi:hypothetical protein
MTAQFPDKTLIDPVLSFRRRPKPGQTKTLDTGLRRYDE